jgi:hypothetical protein
MTEVARPLYDKCPACGVHKLSGYAICDSCHENQRRPAWAIDAYMKWHKMVCDHKDPKACGFEGQPWKRSGKGWARTSTSGKTVVFYENGGMEIQEDFI